MQAPAIDHRSHDDLVAWAEQLARCERAAPGPGLTGAVLADDVVDPAAPERLVARAGTLVDAALADALGRLAWLDVGDLLTGGTLAGDVENRVTGRVYPKGTVVDAVLAQVIEDLARITGPSALIGCTLVEAVEDPAGGELHESGTVVDADVAEVIDRLAWVRIRSWRPRADGQPDAGRALIGILGRFAELVVERLNRAPEKHELAFLNLTGAEPLPPRPARVPLTFALAAGSPVDAPVPARTQAVAAAREGEEDEVVFETERSLVVTRAQLQAVHVADPETDTYRDRTAEATGVLDRPFPPFDGELPAPHELYLACDELLTQPGPNDLVVFLAGLSPQQWSAQWPISWERWDGTAWRAVDATSTFDVGRLAWSVALGRLPQIPRSTVGGRDAGWLRARLDLALPPARSSLAPESVAVGSRQPRDLDLPLAPFGETDPVKFFYLSADEAVAPGRALVRLRVGLERPGAGRVQLTWSYRVGSEWRLLGRSSTTATQVSSGEGVQFVDGTLGFTVDGQVLFVVPETWPREHFRNRIGRWLRVEVDDGSSYTTLPRIAALDVSYEWDLPQVNRIDVQLTRSPEPQPPVAAALGTSALDVTKDFYPFGEEPRFNDTLYLSLPDAVVRPGWNIRMRVTSTAPAATGTKGTSNRRLPVLAWEMWDGRKWRTSPVADRTNALSTDGDVIVEQPDDLGRTTVNGEEGYWLRVRIVAGDYGQPATYTMRQNPDGTTVYVPVPATYAPPVIKTLRFELAAIYQLEAPPSACLAHNGFDYTDHTAAAASHDDTRFAPFAPAADRDPALYLGFDRPFEPQRTTLYLRVEPPLPDDVAADRLAELDPATRAELVWEYASPDGWRPLGVLDETGTLASSGLVTFVGPRDLTQRECFGESRFWLRLRWQRGYFPLPPRLRRVLLNTTWAAQVTTVDGEILGASNGNAHQVFTTAQAPVQPGPRLVVREPEQPPPAEQAALAAAEGADAVTVTRDAGGRPDEIWVRWHRVPDLYESGPRDRHYTLDPLTGEIRFGDGRRGMIPPPGQNNIRVTYRTGGGEQGNRAAGTIVQLASSIPYVDGVTNHEPAEGGAPREPIDRLRARAPQALRHRDRVVTAQDLEDLALAASTAVARATAVTPRFDPTNLWLDPEAPVLTGAHHEVQAGRAGVIVVPTGDAARPTPGMGLLRQVQAFLRERCPPAADVWIAGPEWVRVTVTATIVPTSLEAGDAVGLAVEEALERFLHPLTGGSQGRGWAFGRKPHRSDLFALIEGLAGVDHLASLDVAHEPETRDENLRLALHRALDQSLAEAHDQPPAAELRRWLDRSLVYSGRHEITVALPG